LLILAAVVIVGLLLIGVFWGWDVAMDLVADLLGIERPARETAQGPTTTQETGSTGDYYAVYFTDPVIPFDDVTTGGIDQHLVALINRAETSIDAAMFEFNLPAVADALVAARSRGVRVRVVYDDEHTEEDPQIQHLIDAGIPATPDERGAFMHNKFYVFDGRTVWTGSTNITVNDVYRNNNNVIVIQSERLAENYTAEFEEMFAGQFGPTSPAQTPNPIVMLGGVRIESYFAPEDAVMPAIIEVVQGAQQSISFMAFSFTDYDLAKAMLDRREAGVQVAGIFEQRGANTEYSECNTLLDAGAEVRLDGNPRTFHHKVIIVDDSIVVIGSFNYSTNAAESNDENLIIVHDPEVAAAYRAEFDRRMQEAVMPVGGECLASSD
jgi:phosphatidylserine/phosphatidylglycerophosphate/cardiolipin synthase-like enzyme